MHSQVLNCCSMQSIARSHRGYRQIYILQRANCGSCIIKLRSLPPLPLLSLSFTDLFYYLFYKRLPRRFSAVGARCFTGIVD